MERIRGKTTRTRSETVKQEEIAGLFLANKFSWAPLTRADAGNTVYAYKVAPHVYCYLHKGESDITGISLHVYSVAASGTALIAYTLLFDHVVRTTREQRNDIMANLCKLTKGGYSVILETPEGLVEAYSELSGFYAVLGLKLL
jgi:hypothetical protein